MPDHLRCFYLSNMYSWNLWQPIEQYSKIYPLIIWKKKIKSHRAEATYGDLYGGGGSLAFFYPKLQGLFKKTKHKNSLNVIFNFLNPSEQINTGGKIRQHHSNDPV